MIMHLSGFLKICGGGCLLGMMFVTCADVVGRFFLHPILGSVEIVTFMATLAVAMALPYTHQVKGHIGVEILVRRLSWRTQTIIDLCTGILTLGLFALGAWRMAIYANTIRKSGEYSANLRVPEYLVISLVGFSCLIFVLIIVLDLLQTIQKLRKA
jgi:TRAP-type C4-dicarboxylate transport system permease small subunit